MSIFPNNLKFSLYNITINLLVTLPDGPEVMDIQLWLHVLLAVVGDEGNLKGVVPHEVEGLSDLGHC